MDFIFADNPDWNICMCILLFDCSFDCEVNRMSEQERKMMMNLADTIKGEINRMCVTKELSEFDTMYGHAKRNLDKLSKMIYDARFMRGKQDGNQGERS